MNISANVSNVVVKEEEEEEYVWIWDDATWIMGASFIVFTMQTGDNIEFYEKTKYNFFPPKLCAERFDMGSYAREGMNI